MSAKYVVCVFFRLDRVEHMCVSSGVFNIPNFVETYLIGVRPDYCALGPHTHIALTFPCETALTLHQSGGKLQKKSQNPRMACSKKNQEKSRQYLVVILQSGSVYKKA